ncbi:MAG: hypothetical protein GX593_06680 [Actinomycetales bacterium]|nr:hypothetical protein [Actinomycetales bacterium]
MSDAAKTPAPATSRTRRRARGATTSAIASLLLAGTAAITPAHALSSDLDILDLGTSRASAPATLEGGPSDVVRLESTATTRPGSTTARKPQVLKREASLWMSTHDWNTPDAQSIDDINVLQDVKRKTITITAAYDAPPTAAQNTDLLVWFGNWDAKEEYCHWEMAVLGRAHSTSSTAVAEYKGGKSAGTAKRALSGSTLTLTLTGGAAANAGYGCLYADFFDTVLDANGNPVSLGYSYSKDFTAEWEKAPEFDFYSSDLHPAYPGKWNKVRIVVDNEGNKTAKNVKLKLAGKKMKFKKKTIKVGTIKAGKSKTVYARVKLSGKKTQKLSFRATATDGWTAKSSTKVGYRPKPKKVKSLVGKSYWGAWTGTGSQNIWQVEGMTFVNSKWVYLGVPTKGGIPKCSSKVKECKKYSYSAKKGTLKIGKLRAKVNSEGIKVTKVRKKGDHKLFYSPLKSLKKGSKINAKLQYTDGSGPCPGS